MDEQRTEAWYKSRLGKVTGSRIADVMALNSSDRYKAYLLHLAAERLTGVAQDNFYVTQAMQRGIDLEATAKGAFVLETGIEVEDTGFWLHPEIPNWGCSPDGLTQDGGILEAKCPNSSTHLSYMRDKKLPEKYKPQVMCQLEITQCPHAYFVSYDNRVPYALRLFWVKVERDETYIAHMRNKVEGFLNELEDLINNLLTK